MPKSTAAAFCRNNFENESNGDCAVVFVSQHFFNDLERDEQLSILGHELAHIALGHHDLPIRFLLESKESIVARDRHLLNALSTVQELSCDLSGFIASGGSKTSCESALIKFSTGLTNECLLSWGKQHLGDLLLEQYDAVASSLHANQLATHPLIPCRIKFLQELERILQSKNLEDLFTVESENLNQLAIDILSPIYPEFSVNSDADVERETALLCFAVAMADGELQQAELQRLSQVLSDDSVNYLTSRVMDENLTSDALLARAISMSKEYELDIHCIKRIIQAATWVAASKTSSSLEEQVLFDFASKFGISKDGVIQILNLASSRHEF